MSWLGDRNSTFFVGNNVCWWLSQEIPGIIPDTDAKHQVMMYGKHCYSHCCDGQNADFALLKLNKSSNLNINDAAWLYVVHILQRPSSRPSTKSTQNPMVNVPKKNLSPLPAGKYSKSTKHSTRRHYQANQGKSGLEAEWVWALGALRRLRSKKKKLAAGNRRETQFLSKEEKEKWIEDYVERETTAATKRVEDAETAIRQKQDDMRTAEKGGLTTMKPDTSFEEILNGIGDSLSDLASSDAGEDGEQEDDDEDDPAGGWQPRVGDGHNL